MENYQYQPQIKQLAAAMMRLYPKSWLDMADSCVTINFSGGAAFRFSYDDDGFLDTVNVSPNSAFKNSIHHRTMMIEEIRWLLSRGWRVPAESDLCMRVFEEIRNGDLEEDIAFFDNNVERHQLSRLEHQRKNSVNTILGIILFITCIVFKSGAIEESDSVFLHNVMDTLKEFTGLNATLCLLCIILLLIVIYNSIFAFRYSLKRKKGLVV